MHPKIRKFWEDAGYTISENSIIDSQEGWKNNNPYIRLLETLRHGNRYRFNGKWYSEQEMLKIIKLSAFY